MAKLSLSEVSKKFNVSRSTLYRAIKEGRISRNADGLFDVSEVIRCFGDVTPKIIDNIPMSKSDEDLRQLIEFMKKEIEAYKDREQRYLDQIDRFQLLIEHKENIQKSSNDTSLEHNNDAPRHNTNETSISLDNKAMERIETSYETSMKCMSEAPQDNSLTHYETSKKELKKRGLFGRVLHAVLSDD